MPMKTMPTIKSTLDQHQIDEALDELDKLDDPTLLERCKASDGGRLAKKHAEVSNPWNNHVRICFYRHCRSLSLPEVCWYEIANLVAHDQVFYWMWWNDRTGKPIRDPDGLLPRLSAEIYLRDTEGDQDYEEFLELNPAVRTKTVDGAIADARRAYDEHRMLLG